MTWTFICVIMDIEIYSEVVYLVNWKRLFSIVTLAMLLMAENHSEAGKKNRPPVDTAPLETAAADLTDTAIFDSAGTVNQEQVTLLGQNAIEIKQGMRGDGVMDVQRSLAHIGYEIGEIDGIFGSQTLQAVKAFQSMHKLPETGIVDDVTLAALHRAEPLSSRGMRMIPMQASGYSAYDPGNSYYTATGSFLRRGIVAVDPNLIPLGTKLFIPGYGYAVADDTGGSIIGTRIDLAFDTHEEALWFGRRSVIVYIVE